MEQLWQTTARYGLPYFANFINSDLRPDDARSMCCRLAPIRGSCKNRAVIFLGALLIGSRLGVVAISFGLSDR
ncbi:hypothetical protein JWJ90_07290 [Desulfobulbus rhabdoformis]|uniref:hypothetical protein n=1 Tax=Desulfobulbus rhabdoformis TaxID=34032 RepID=UPI00196606A8|nr:hypothetical protein [Desulfobulbus rhabdoformis]MBM9614089.1 hypothetical protein [Desulfobulbus rhabdoformis]